MNDIELKKLEDMMEEIANMPSLGPPVRQPGEKCMYEIQRDENYDRVS